MNLLKLIFLSFLIPAVLVAQRIHPHIQIEWEKNFGSDQIEIFHNIIETKQGDFAMVGKTQQQGSEADIFLLMTNQNGLPILQKQYGGSSEDAAYTIIEAMDGGFFIGGYTQTDKDSLVQRQGTLLKIDEQGQVLWQKNYGKEGLNEIKDLVQLKDEGIIVTGQHNNNLWLAKLSPDGEIIWEHILKGFPSVGNSLALTQQEEIIIAGNIQVLNKDQNSQITLVKANKEGEVFWVKNYNDAGATKSSKVIILDNGDFAVSGHAISRIYRDDMFLLITDSNGLLKIAKAYGGKKSDGGNALAQATNGDIYLIGFSKERTDPNDSGWVNRVNFANGERVWENDRLNFITHKISDHLYDIIIASDGSPMMVGATSRLGKGQDAWLVKLDSEGLPSVINPPVVGVSKAILMDANRDSILSPDERAFISFQISNESTQHLYNVQARCSTNSPQDIEVFPVVKIGKIPANSTMNVTVPIKTIQNIVDSTHRIAIDFIEANNAEIPSLVFEFKTSIEVLKPRIEKSN